jgi:hypothetical protein
MESRRKNLDLHSHFDLLWRHRGSIKGMNAQLFLILKLFIDNNGKQTTVNGYLEAVVLNFTIGNIANSHVSLATFY